MGFPSDADGKEPACNARDPGLIPGLGRAPGGGHSNPFQYSCLENPMDRGAWWATVHGVTKSQTQLKSKTKVAAGLVFLQPLLGLQMLPFSVEPSSWETAASAPSLLCACTSLVSRCVLTSSPYKNTSQMGLELALTVLF